jgi:adenylate cyclase
MQRRLVRLNSQLVKLGFAPLEVGIGINTGDVTVGCVGSDRRMDYTAIGNAVNLASRLMSQAKGRQIMISDSTHALLGDVFRTEIMGDMNLKGATKVHQVIYY